MKCVAMLDFENSSASVVTSGKHAAAQKYQEFVPELDQWLSIVANPGPSAPVRKIPSRKLLFLRHRHLHQLYP